MKGNGQLAVCVPSRGRPATFHKLYHSFMQTRTPDLSYMILRTGEADPQRGEYAHYFDEMPGLLHYTGADDGFNSTWEGTAGYGPALQDIWEMFPWFSAYLCIEDDCVLETPGFDRWILDTLAKMPGEVGMIELHDRSHTIHVQAFSAAWLDAVGGIAPGGCGEHFFQVAKELVRPEWTADAKGHAEFTHYPLLRGFGYEGNERKGAVEQPDVVSRFHLGVDWIRSRWLPTNLPYYRQQLEAAAKGGTE